LGCGFKNEKYLYLYYPINSPNLPPSFGRGGYRWGREIITIKQLAN